MSHVGPFDGVPSCLDGFLIVSQLLLQISDWAFSNALFSSSKFLSSDSVIKQCSFLIFQFDFVSMILYPV